MKNILVPIDFSDVSEAVVSQASIIAGGCGGKMWIIHVAPPEPDFVGYDAGPDTEREFQAGQLRHEHRQLQQIADRLRETGLDAESLLVSGQTNITILEHAKRRPADLIVIGSHGHGALYHLIAGSVTQYILKHAPCPVMVVPSNRTQ